MMGQKTGRKKITPTHLQIYSNQPCPKCRQNKFFRLRVEEKDNQYSLWVCCNCRQYMRKYRNIRMGRRVS